MAKMLKVGLCRGCRFFLTDGTGGKTGRCGASSNSPTNGWEAPPEWCPLPDYPDYPSAPEAPPAPQGSEDSEVERKAWEVFTVVGDFGARESFEVASEWIAERDRRREEVSDG